MDSGRFACIHDVLESALSMRRLAQLGLLAASFAAAPAAFAQGCAMCYTTAAAQSPKAQAALNHGILVLLIPPLSMFIGILVFLYRRRNATRPALIAS